MGIPVELISIALNGPNGSWDRLLSQFGFALLSQRLPGTAGELSEQSAVATKRRPQHPGNRPDLLAVVDCFQNLVRHPLDQGSHPFGLTSRTEVSGLTGEGEQIFRATMGTADAGQTMMIDPALQKPLNRSFNDRAQRAIVLLVKVGIALLELLPVAFQTLVEGSVFRMPLLVGAAEGHHLPVTFDSRNLRGSLYSGYLGRVTRELVFAAALIQLVILLSG